MTSRKEIEITVKNRIFEAAKDEFLKKGYDGARMQEIADKAEINKAMLHYYFGTKERLFQKVFADLFVEFIPKLLDLLQSKAPFLDILKRFIEIQFDIIHKNPDLPLFLNYELARGNVHLKKLFDKKNKNSIYLEFAELLQIEVKNKRIRPIEPTQLIVNILALNVFPFISKNMILINLQLDPLEYKLFLETRKEQVFEFIVNAIKIDSHDKSN